MVDYTYKIVAKMSIGHRILQPMQRCNLHLRTGMQLTNPIKQCINIDLLTNCKHSLQPDKIN